MVHLKGHFCPTCYVAVDLREQTRGGKTVNAVIVQTTSTSERFANPGQANYDAANPGIATFKPRRGGSALVRHCDRSNVIEPAGRGTCAY